MAESFKPEPFGRYQLIRRFARGGMAEVFLARQEGPGGFARELVIKRVLPDLVDDPHFVELFLDEARLAAKLTHPNIVPIFDFGEVDGSYFIGMELVNGPSLRNLARSALRSGQPLSYGLLARVGAEIAKALTYVHSFQDNTGRAMNIVHRDISPSNIVISAEGVPKLLDFGVARAAQSLHQTRSGEIKGKLPYMAPEQLSGDKDLDARVDIYALGVVLYEMSTGRRPFTSDNDYALMLQILGDKTAPKPSDLQANFPTELERILLRAIAKDPEQRYPKARALAHDLETFVYGLGKPVTSFDLAEKIATCEKLQGESLRPVPPSVSKVPRAVTLPSATLQQANPVPKPAPVETHVSSATASQGLAPTAPDLPQVHPADVTIHTTSQRRFPIAPPKPNLQGVDLAAPEAGTHTLMRQTAAPKKRKIIVASIVALSLLGWFGYSYWQALRPEFKQLGGSQPSNTGATILPSNDAGPAQGPGPIAQKSALDSGNAAHNVSKDARTNPAKPHDRPSPARPTAAKAHSTLQVSSQPSLKLSVDGESRGSTPQSLRLTPGRHLVALHNSDGQTQYSETLRLRASKTLKRHYDLRPGQLAIFVQPWAEIFVDGVKRGVTPMPPLRLSPGKHQVELRNPKRATQVHHIDITAGKAQTLRAELKP